MFHRIYLDYAVDDSGIPWDFELVSMPNQCFILFFLKQLISFEADPCYNSMLYHGILVPESGKLFMIYLEYLTSAVSVE